MSETNGTLCSTCTKSIWCPTWAQWKCLAYSMRIRDNQIIDVCDSYRKRNKNFKEPKCQCEDCLKNELLYEEDCDE